MSESVILHASSIFSTNPKNTISIQKCLGLVVVLRISTHTNFANVKKHSPL